jgi:hypothetical protein
MPVACDVRRATQILLLTLTMAMPILAPSGADAQVIDRVLAVVDASIITLSDTIGALRLGLIKTPSGADPMAQAVQLMIERQLMLAEIERYAIAPPPPAEVDKRMDEIRGRVGSPEAVDRALLEWGLTMDQLRRQIADTLRIDAYLQQRFGSVFQQPTEDELLMYYKSHTAEFTRGGEVRPFSEVHDSVRAAVMAGRRASQIRDWTEGLRRRATISILPNGPGR